ncbi:hypothetical protein BpHYR1_046372 [Brachionus plicatilis]|uniref:Uncharacterized protein n=1 Tax=Brachionus plicatilis TaxID=10195 RepID=A0A3M7P9T3_BRAPC|nr:hypothetical protein BpHYR1_046372 [Brachionus plicatilis]
MSFLEKNSAFFLTKGTKKCEKRDVICDVRYLGIGVILNRLQHEFFAVPDLYNRIPSSAKTLQFSVN